MIKKDRHRTSWLYICPICNAHKTIKEPVDVTGTPPETIICTRVIFGCEGMMEYTPPSPRTRS